MNDQQDTTRPTPVRDADLIEYLEERRKNRRMFVIIVIMVLITLWFIATLASVT